ncbi:MAG: tRNA (N(6)-L-threonylcarbamoyladenosine(37)-C(2))-methylthiotransferase MtaB [Bacteroidota bacterium]
MMKVALHTLGCKLNFAETSTLGKRFVERGFEVVGIDEPADVFVLNTCSVTERADRECRQLVRRARRNSPQAYIAVVGCYAQLRPQEIASIEGVDLVLGSKEKFDLVSLAAGFQKQGSARILVSPVEEVRNFGVASSAGFGDRTRAFLKVQDGCDYSCAFCTIPLARGESRSIPVQDVVSQAREIVEDGYKEIVLTGVNVGDYGKKIDTSLLSLVRALSGVDGLERIRVSSIEPNLLTDELLDFWFAEPKLCKHWHIPLQSGSDTILRSMRRRYLKDVYADRVERIKSAVPHAGVGADVIVGFPGETEALFRETYGFLADLPVTYLHVFTYSERPNTDAGNLPNPVEPRVRSDRSELLRMLSLRKRRSFFESRMGSESLVLFESQKNREWSTGLTGEYIRVDVASSRDLTNQILSVKIKEAFEDACRGEITRQENIHEPEIQHLVA